MHHYVEFCFVKYTVATSNTCGGQLEPKCAGVFLEFYQAWSKFDKVIAKIKERAWLFMTHGVVLYIGHSAKTQAYITVNCNSMPEIIVAKF